MASSHEITSCWTGRNALWKPQTHTKVTGDWALWEWRSTLCKVPFCTAWPAVAGEDPVWWPHAGYPELPGYLSPGLHGTGTAVAGNPAVAWSSWWFSGDSCFPLPCPPRSYGIACELRVACLTGSISPATLGSSGHLFFVCLCASLQEEVQPFKNNFWTVFMFLQRQTLPRQLTCSKSLWLSLKNYN